jgi:ABC-type dipeptide/oligopeptide/nickel transport system permease component
MGRYVIRRLLQFIPTVLGAMFLLHYLTSVGIQLTGNPVRAFFGDRTPPPALVAAISAKLGLDDPCLTRAGDPCVGLFVHRLQNIFLHFDFGVNRNRVAVTELIDRAYPNTLKLALLAFTIEVVIGITAGVLAGLRGGSFWDYAVKISTVLLISFPVFVVGVAIRSYVATPLSKNLREVDWIPDLISKGILSPVYKADYPLASMILPAMVLASLSLATTARLTRTTLMHGQGQGPQAAPGHRRARPAQLADPGGHLPGRRLRHAPRRRRHHRDDLQRARHRPAGHRGRPAGRGLGRGRRGHAAGAGVPRRQPDRGHALRRARPEDPL